MRFQLLAARAAFAALVLAVLVAGVAIAGVRLDKLSYANGLRLMWPATALGLLALVLALLWFRRAFIRNAGEGKRMGLIALVGSLAFLYPPLSTAWRGLTLPPIHDASTDPEEPPQFKALAKLRRPGMNGPDFDGQAKIRYWGKEVTIAYALHDYRNGLITKPHTKLLPGSADPVGVIFWRCFEAAKKLGWTIVDYSAREGRIEATASSFWFGQISDIVIRVRQSGPIAARADIRAESRMGAIDNGFNIRLLAAFKEKAGI